MLLLPIGRYSSLRSLKTLYVSDLDGTLLRDDITLSEHSRRELTALILEGVPITIASARSIYSIRPLLGDIPFRLPIIEINGAFITDYATGHKEIVRSIGREHARMAFETIIAAGSKPFISGHRKNGDFLYFSDVINPGMEAYVRERREAGGDLVSTSFEYRNFPGWHFFTLHERLATKDHAIAFLRSGWGLEDAELVVFGDDVKARGSRSARPLDHNARAVISSPHVHRRPPERAYGSTRPLGLRDGDP